MPEADEEGAIFTMRREVVVGVMPKRRKDSAILLFILSENTISEWIFLLFNLSSSASLTALYAAAKICSFESITLASMNAYSKSVLPVRSCWCKKEALRMLRYKAMCKVWLSGRCSRGMVWRSAMVDIGSGERE